MNEEMNTNVVLDSDAVDNILKDRVKLKISIIGIGNAGNQLLNEAIKREDVRSERIKNAVEFVLQMPYDYALYILKHFFDISDEVRYKVENMESFKKWFKIVEKKSDKV